jgi:membrane protein
MDDQTQDTAPSTVEANRGRNAAAPSEIPAPGWKDVLWRTFSEVMDDRVTLIAAGVTYYLLLALFPALGVLVSLYGLIADAASIEKQMGFLVGIVPAGGLDLIRAQLHNLTAPRNSTLGIALVVSFLFALWSANNGMKALFEAMNVAYGEREKRNIIVLNVLSMAFTIGALLVVIALIFVIGIVPAALALLYLDAWTETLARWTPWPFMLLLVGTGTMLIYRYGPSREDAKIRWITWGAVMSTLLWMISTIAFSYYLNNFSDYNATYGTLGALVAFMVWVWLSVVILIIGAELNAELEHQTKQDSTTGSALPMGERGAVMADTLGKSSDE